MQFIWGLIAGIVVGLVMEWVVDWAGLLPRRSPRPDDNTRTRSDSQSKAETARRANNTNLPQDIHNEPPLAKE